MKAVFPAIRASTFAPSSKDESVAVWAFQKNRAPEDRPRRLPDADALHIPLVTGDRAEGVLTVRLANPPTRSEQRELLDAFAAQLALFVNKERALEESRAAQVAASIAETAENAFRFCLA